ncbi:MAG: SDR family oxidoreductase [Pirellulales bacterium]
MADWTNKVAVICGGSSGLGLNLARALVGQSCGVLVLIGRDGAKLAAAGDELSELLSERSSNTRIETISADLTDKVQSLNCAEQLSEITPKVDLLIQAIGVSDRGMIEDLTKERLYELFDTNVVTSLHALQVFSPRLAATGGVAVLIGSLASLFAPRFLGGYSIAKHALAALAQQARLELVEKNIQVMLCCPGPIRRNDAGQRYREQASASVPAEALKPAGGAKISQLDPDELSQKILAYAAARRPMLILPVKGRLLRLLTAISQRLGDLLLRRRSA